MASSSSGHSARLYGCGLQIVTSPEVQDWIVGFGGRMSVFDGKQCVIRIGRLLDRYISNLVGGLCFPVLNGATPLEEALGDLGMIEELSLKSDVSQFSLRD